MTPAEEFCKLNGIESIKDGDSYYPYFDDAMSILEVMMKRKDWDDFVDKIGDVILDNEYINIIYVINPGKLLNKAIIWCKDNKL